MTITWTDELDRTIHEGFHKGLSAREIGESMGVSRNAVLGRAFQIGPRDAAKTRLIKRYGHAALAAGRTPREALHKMAEAKALAFAAAVEASRLAKTKFRERAIAKMREDIAAGADRNACIFAARADGVTLEMIGAEFGLTRERVRQICNAHAQRLALQNLHITVAPAEQAA